MTRARKPAKRKALSPSERAHLARIRRLITPPALVKTAPKVTLASRVAALESREKGGTAVAAYGIVEPADDAPIPDLRAEPVRPVRGVSETAWCGDIDIPFRSYP